MKKLLLGCLVLVFTLGFAAVALAELVPEEIPPENETYTFVRDFVYRWRECQRCTTCEYQNVPATFYVTFSRMEGDADQWPEPLSKTNLNTLYLSDHDYKWICDDCARMPCWDLEEDCVCYELYGNPCENIPCLDRPSPPFYLYIYEEYQDWVTKVKIDETEDSENECQPGELLMCKCGCAVEECVEPCNELAASGGCCHRNDDDCGWFHLPYYEVERYDTRPGAQDFFFDVIEGKADFVVRNRWYNWEVEVCDECENGDVTLWETCDPCDCHFKDAEIVGPGFFRMDLCNCDNIESIELEILLNADTEMCHGDDDDDCCCSTIQCCDDDDCDDCGETGCPGPCEPDRWYGIWRFVEYDSCDPGCGWEPVDSEFVQTCSTPLCGGEECECSIKFSFDGTCGESPCDPGSLCVLECDTFVAAYKESDNKDGLFSDGTYWKTKTWACDLCEDESIGLMELDKCCLPGDLPAVVSTDGAIFTMFDTDYEPDDPEVCRLEVCGYMKTDDCADKENMGVFLENGEYWLEFPVTWSDVDDLPGYACKGCVLVTLDDLDGLGLTSFKELIGEVWGIGPKDNFPTEAPVPGDDDDDNDSGTGGDGDDDDDSSGGGCNVGFAASMLLFVVPLVLLGVRKF
ncbi:MAG: SYNERG-CTERM sorting domain-containing protein [Synergistales bacterium]|nr:SYNERG-CTERM sorting domain-containing protein [Synergistales bacterium]